MKDSNATQETFNSVDPANPEIFSPFLLPDAASLLRVHFWACFTLEVCGKLGLVGEGNICPPRSREVAIKALGGSCQVNSSKNVFAYRPCVLEKIFIADIPRAQRAPVKSVTQLKWNIILGRNFYLLSPRKAGLKWSWIPGHIAFWLPATFGRHGTLPAVESAFMYTYSCVDFLYRVEKYFTFEPPLSAMFSPWSWSPFDIGQINQMIQ